MRTNAQREDKVKIGNEEAEEVEEFVYLGATVTKDGGGTEDIKKRLNRSRGAFFNLTRTWKTHSEYWSKHENQPVQDTDAASTTVWMQSLEDNQI